MKNTFYVIHTKSDMYQLRLRKTHMVLSTAHDLDTILANLKKIVIRYGNMMKLSKAIRNMEADNTLGFKELSRREEEYETVGEKFYEFVEDMVDAARKECVRDEPVLKNKSRLKIMTPVFAEEKPKEVRETKSTTFSKGFKKIKPIIKE